MNNDNYPVLNPEYGANYIGGESVQQILLAKAFAKRGHEVSTIVADLGQQDGEIIDDVRVLTTFSPGSGLPVLRFIHPKITSIVSALRRADADIYYQSCAGMFTGVTAWFAQRHKRKFIFRVASDSDCIPGQQLVRYWRDKKIYEYGLKNADLISVQSARQAALLKDNYKLESLKLNMVAEPPDDLNRERDIDVLWVNNFRALKKPERVLELARMLPDVNFTMVGGPCPGEQSLYDDVHAQVKTIKNIHMTGFVPYHKVNSYYSRARVFINTSIIEGFPNSYLQSWVRGTPVITFLDPDDLIMRNGLGYRSDSVKDMADAIRDHLDDGACWEQTSARSRSYAIDNYHPDGIAEKYENIFKGIGIAG